MIGYEKGINLGGWISQYGDKGDDHFRTFITEKDIERIASWGMDHIRLPFDYKILESDSKPFKYSEEGFSYIDACLEWCRKYGLHTILDLHLAPGQSYDSFVIAENPILAEELNGKRFRELWKTIAVRYRNLREGIIFELLNEIVDMTNYMWNPFVKKGLAAIREMDKDRVVMIGSNLYNSVLTLKELAIPEDPNVVFNFHFYEPHLFTHQKAHWSAEAQAYNREILYPGEFPELRDFLEERPEFARDSGKYAWHKNDKNLLLLYLQEAALFAGYVGKPLYCGEFGVIDVAPVESTLNWLKDFTGILKEYGIGWAYWTYKELDFGIVGRDGGIARKEVLECLRLL